MMKKILAAVGAMAIVIGGGIVAFSDGNTVPELVTYEDTDGSIEIPEEEVPLARSFFVDLDDQISIDEDEVPLARMNFFFANSDVPELTDYTDPVIETTITGDDTPL